MSTRLAILIQIRLIRWIKNEVKFDLSSSLLRLRKRVEAVLIFYYAEADAGETGEMGYRQNQQGTIFVKDTKFSLKNGMIR